MHLVKTGGLREVRLRSSSEIEPESYWERFVWEFDQAEIDAPNPRSFRGLRYRERLNEVVEMVVRYSPVGGRIADVGCAQGNVAITLAEAGFDVDAYDLNPDFIRYAQKKWVSGSVRWHVGDVFELEGPDAFNALILGEIIEHVARPAELLQRCLAMVAVGGVVILTTPNRHCIAERLPSYSEAVQRFGVTRLEREQFGPAGEHHLFALSADDLRSLIPPTAVVMRICYLESILVNSHAQSVLNGRAGMIYLRLVRELLRVPGFRAVFGSGLLAVIRRVS